MSYRPWHGGKKSVKPRFSSALVESTEQLAKFFKWEWEFFEQYIPNTTYTEEVLKPLSFYTNGHDLVEYVQTMRELGDDECILDFGIDGGGGPIKVTLNLIEPRTEILESPKKTVSKKRKTPLKAMLLYLLLYPLPVVIGFLSMVSYIYLILMRKYIMFKHILKTGSDEIIIIIKK